MAKRNFKYNNTVDLTSVPQNNRGYYLWEEAIGKTVPFTFNDEKLCGEFKIVDYKIPDELTHKHVYLEYNGQLLKPILPSGLKNATISNILDGFYIEWAYKVGDRIITYSKDITIIDRFRKKDKAGMLRKFYKIHCNICGFDSGEHYINGEYRKFWSVTECDLIRTDDKNVGCPCCSNRIVSVGINDIPTTDPWMVDYFQGGYDEAKMFSPKSSQRKYFKCPFCGEIKNKDISIDALCRTKTLSCFCNDNISYPNKFAYYTLKQLNNQYSYYTTEYSPKWAENYRYDNYIEFKNQKLIIEMDGGLGHGNKTWGSKETDIVGLERDKIKEMLAKDNNIILERVDCKKSNFEYIAPKIVEVLIKYFDISSVDFNFVESQCRQSNAYKNICEYYNFYKCSVADIVKTLDYSSQKVYKALKIGNKVGWCNFEFEQEANLKINQEIINYWNSNNSCKTSDISRALGCGQGKIIKVLKEATNKGLCYYNAEDQRKKNYENREGCEIYVYNKHIELLKRYDTIKECIDNSMTEFHVEFCQRDIYNVCNGRLKTHKGFVFSKEELKKEDFDKNYFERKSNKEVYVYTKDIKFISKYISAKELQEKSEKDFGEKILSSNVSRVCNGFLQTYKGYVFSHNQLD